MGAVISAVAGAAFVHRLSEDLLERLILVLLVAIGAALIVEGFLPTSVVGFLPDDDVVYLLAGFGFGLGIGLVSSLLGVAGGEVIIPTLVFAYGAGIKTAGTAGLFVSLPTVAVGIFRHARRGAYDKRAITETVVPMGLGSVIGAVAGGLLVGLVSPDVLKVGLGLVLIGSAIRIFRASNRAA